MDSLPLRSGLAWLLSLSAVFISLTAVGYISQSHLSELAERAPEPQREDVSCQEYWKTSQSFNYKMVLDASIYYCLVTQLDYLLSIFEG